MTKIIKLPADEWWAFLREGARLKGYYYVEELGAWRESDTKVYKKYHHPLRILYIHPLASPGSSTTINSLRKSLPYDKIYAPKLPVKPQKALTKLQELVKKEQINIIIDESMNKVFAQKLQFHNRIEFKPGDSMFLLLEHVRIIRERHVNIRKE